MAPDGQVSIGSEHHCSVFPNPQTRGPGKRPAHCAISAATASATGPQLLILPPHIRLSCKMAQCARLAGGYMGTHIRFDHPPVG